VTVADNDTVPTSVPSAVVSPPAGRHRGFLAAAHLDLVDRPLDPGLGAELSDLLDRGLIDKAEAVRRIQRTEAYREALVRRLVLQVLRRQPTRKELVVHTQYLRRGGSMEGLLAVLFGLPEYTRRFGGGSRAGYLRALYRDVLGGTPDAA